MRQLKKSESTREQRAARQIQINKAHERAREVSGNNKIKSDFDRDFAEVPCLCHLEERTEDKYGNDIPGMCFKCANEPMLQHGRWR